MWWTHGYGCHNTGQFPTFNLPPNFQIDCWATDSEKILDLLNDPQHNTFGRCKWTQRNLKGQGIKGRTLFWGTPKKRMDDTIDRLI